MVLQRAPSSAVIYGTVELSPTALDDVVRHKRNVSDVVEVDVTVQGSEGHLQTRIVSADVEYSMFASDDGAGGGGGGGGNDNDNDNSNNLATFRATLPPMGISSSIVNTLKKTAPATHSYSIYVRCKTGCDDRANHPSRSNVASIHDVKFGDVYLCLGEGDMGIPLRYTFARNASAERVRHGGYSNIRYKSLGGNMNAEMQWSKPTDALAPLGDSSSRDDDNNAFMQYSATCYYFAEALVDQLGIDAPPLGLIEVAYSSSRIEDWMDDDDVATCTDAMPKMMNGGTGVYDTDVVPLMDLSIKGWLWYQGSSNMAGRFGNATSGYACLLPRLIESYRRRWSTNPGTTSPNAPFGIVTLHPSGANGLPDAGGMRLAQTAGYGTIPNPAMPNTFSASAYDLNDPYDDTTCYDGGCCDPAIVFGNRDMGRSKCSGRACDVCSECRDYCDTLSRTNFFTGPANPRAKRFVGERLAQSAAVEVYGKPGDGVGPTLAGCRVMSDNSVVIHFRRKLLGGERVVVRDYDEDLTMSKMEVLVNPDAFCVQTRYENGKMICIDDGSGSVPPSGGSDPYSPGSGAWMPVDIESAGAAEVRVNLTKAGGVAHAIRYAWDGTCCSNDPSVVNADGAPRKACPVASCPIVGNETLLPADPFIARIINGKCECLSPDVCDASLGLQAFRFRAKDVPVTEKSFLVASGSLLGFILLVCCFCMCRNMCSGTQREKEGYEMVNLDTIIPGDDDKVDDHEVW